MLKKILQKILHKLDYHIRKHRVFRKKVDGENLVGAEIGVFKGENAKRLLDYLDIDKLYLIDPYGGFEDYDGWGGGRRGGYKSKKDSS